MKRRAFFQSLAKAAAIIALAPRIAFRVPEETFYHEGIQYRSNTIGIREQLRLCANTFDPHADNSLDMQKFFNTVFAVSRNREQRDRSVLPLP